MGCSSSTQTQFQDSNRPSSKLEERNGGSRCAPDRNGLTASGSETIPDQSQLPEAEDFDIAPAEVVTSEPSPSEAVGDLEVAPEIGRSSVAAVEEPEIPAAPLEAAFPIDTDDIGEIQPSGMEGQTEGKVEEELESEINVDPAFEEVETNEEKTDDTVASEVTEIKSKED
ncbi:uncharacterized protein LOC132209628 isoform X2 [Stegostoma tigrinum]|uniref:uncharacterized protein LOC132209628 isoform X2 n=1 Tax=Stegostoma tigrinum TaxID=3053191 RepID=UPI0028708DA6|nr:uncharacterized protein LOC132209628 isoform X2 [Stegostoma tigrinum]